MKAYGCQNPAFTAALAMTNHHFSDNVGVLMAKFRLGCDEVFFLSFLMPLKFMSAFPKNNCVLQFVILSILALILIITILFAFDTF
jgi:hypothetical protein